MRKTRMALRNTGRLGDQRGLALFTVTVFVFIVTLVGLAYFAVAGYETHGALYRQNSSEAFYLADAGVEHARSEFIKDMNWMGPLTDVPAGNGKYSVTVAPGTWNGSPTYDLDGVDLDVLKIHSEGEVRNARRAIDTWVTVPNVFFGDLMIVMNDLDSNGNICLGGNIHANNEADFGPHDVHLKCGTYTEKFHLDPPTIHTEPSYYAGSTYYYVIAVNLPGEPLHAKVYDAEWNPLNSTFPAPYDSLRSIMTMNGGHVEYNFQDADMVKYFDPDTRYFKADTLAGQHSVVVNFAAVLLPFPANTADINIQRPQEDPSITQTFINTRFTGGSEEQRLDTKFWSGGTMTFQGNPKFEPSNGVAIVCHNFDQGNAKLTIGTPGHPALLYVTHDVNDVQGDFKLQGAVIVLHDWYSQGGPSLTYDKNLLQILPPSLGVTEPEGGSGQMLVLEWREVAANP
jgi:hypothetical protein